MSSNSGNVPPSNTKGTSTGGREPAGKGKERETASQQPGAGSSTQPEDGGRSVITRIADSAAGLANSMLSGTPSSSVLANSVSEKGSTSTAVGSTQEHGETSSHFPRPLPDFHIGGSQQQFRSSQTQAHAAAQEAAFSDFLDSTPVFQPSRRDTLLDDEAPWHMTSTAETTGSVPVEDTGPHTYSSVAEQERHDGEAVVSLLMDANEHLPDSLEDDVLSPDERQNLRNALFGPASGRGGEEIDWNHVLNFIPEYLRSDDPNLEAYLDTGMSDPAEAWDSWVGQWQEVLSRYHDEVWGDLGSLVEEARQEVEQLAQVKGDELPPGTPALRRLRAILGHLRG